MSSSPAFCIFVLLVLPPPHRLRFNVFFVAGLWFSVSRNSWLLFLFFFAHLLLPSTYTFFRVCCLHIFFANHRSRERSFLTILSLCSYFEKSWYIFFAALFSLYVPHWSTLVLYRCCIKFAPLQAAASLSVLFTFMWSFFVVYFTFTLFLHRIFLSTFSMFCFGLVSFTRIFSGLLFVCSTIICCRWPKFTAIIVLPKGIEWMCTWLLVLPLRRIIINVFGIDSVPANLLKRNKGNRSKEYDKELFYSPLYALPCFDFRLLCFIDSCSLLPRQTLKLGNDGKRLLQAK